MLLFGEVEVGEVSPYIVRPEDLPLNLQSGSFIQNNEAAVTVITAIGVSL